MVYPLPTKDPWYGVSQICRYEPRQVSSAPAFMNFHLYSGTLAVSVGFACAGFAQAQNAVKITTNYYTVSASTARELRARLDQSQPWKGRRPSDASTDWNIQWTYSVVSSETGCRVRSVETKTEITITLPRWVPGPDSSPGLVQHWEDYLKALMEHEAGHCRIVQAAAAEIRKRTQMLRETPTCEALGDFINAAANKALSEYRAQEAQYDRKTGNGATQGARFP